MTEITQADWDATEELWNEVDLCTCDRCHVFTAEAFARHRKYGYDQGYYDGRQMDHIAKPDPLVDAVKDILDDDSLHNADEFSEALCAALAKRGLEIREREQWNTSSALSSAGSGHSSVI